MKLLHIADLHLGRQFNGISLEADQQAALDQIIAAAAAHRVEAVLIAGDVFDRAAPPVSAVRQWNGFLARLTAETDAAVAAIAGNHDSGDRIETMAGAADARRFLIRGAVRAEEAPLVLHDAHGPVAFSAPPFAYEYAAREALGDESLATPEDVLRAQMAAARRAVPEGARWVVVAHAFVTGGACGETERALTRVGGIETVGADVFEGADYVALGHLHRPQSVGAPHIRYSGAPLAFGFDEAGAEKSMSLVEMDAAGAVTVQALPFAPLRGVRVLRGRCAELLAAPPSDDFVKAVLTDEAPVIDAMARLRAVFPNACELSYARDERAPEVKARGGRAAAAAADPIEVVGDFMEAMRGERLAEGERAALIDALAALRAREDAQ